LIFQAPLTDSLLKEYKRERQVGRLKQAVLNLRGFTKQRSTIWFSIAFLAPSIILFTVVLIYPVILTGYISLTRWDGINAMKFIGFDNFNYLFTRTGDFWITLRNTIIAPILCNVIQIPIALVLSFMVYRCKKGFNFFQSVYFVPVILSSTIMGMMFSLFFNGQVGPLNAILRDLGINSPPNWLSNPKITLYTVLMPAIWQYIGYFFIIILAGMQSIPDEVIESATMDGANSFKLFTGIAVPLSKDIVQICIILNTIGALKSFDLSFIMTAGGPGVSSSFLAVLMYRQALVSNSYGRASAIAFILLAVALIATVLLNWLFGMSERKESREGGR
jgi:raffinose/stachyose/melibiose transport system permease protein